MSQIMKKSEHILKRAAYIVMALMAAAIIFMSSSYSRAGSLLGSTHDFNDLRANHVKLELEDIEYEDVVFETTNSQFEYRDWQLESKTGEVRDCKVVCYHGPVSWGTKNRTQTEDAVFGKKEIAGSFTIRLKNKAVLPDGKRADILMRFYDLKLYSGAMPDGVSAGQSLYAQIVHIGGDGMIRHDEGPYRTSLDKSSWVRPINCSQEITTTISVVEHGTTDPIDPKYDTMMMRFKDIDIADMMVATGKLSELRYGGKFSEGIAFVDSWYGPYRVSDPTKIVSDNVDGVQKLRGSGNDEETPESEFIAAGSPKSLTYKWYGSLFKGATAEYGDMMWTVIGTAPDVTVKAGAGEGGSIEKEGLTSYILNQPASYAYVPEPGYRVKRLTVDGEDVKFNDNGGKYTFDRVTMTDSDPDHELYVEYEPIPVLFIDKKVSEQSAMPGDTLSYSVTVSQDIDGAEAHDVIVKDELPQGIILEVDSIDLPEGAELVSVDETGYEVSIPVLTGVATIEYQCEVEDDASSGAHVNTVTASSINTEKSVSAEASVNIGQPDEEEGETEEEVPEVDSPGGTDAGSYSDLRKDVKKPKKEVRVLSRKTETYPVSTGDKHAIPVLIALIVISLLGIIVLRAGRSK